MNSVPQRKITKMKTDKASVRSRLLTFGVAALAVVADQLSKIAAVSSLERVGASRTVIPGALSFTYVLNSGATAGMLSNHRWIFMTVSTVVIIALVAYIALGRAKGKLFSVSLALILAGGVGNMIDRVARGTVVDFIDVTLVDFFPFNTVFNVADMFVCVGAALLIVSVIISEVSERKKSKDAAGE